MGGPPVEKEEEKKMVGGRKKEVEGYAAWTPDWTKMTEGDCRIALDSRSFARNHDNRNIDRTSTGARISKICP